MSTHIQWTDETWNPVTGCRKVSPGCAHCYAERLAPRVFAGQTVDTGAEYRGGVAYPVTRARRFTDVRCHPERLDTPLRWRKPRRVFVNSMSDLFHEDVPPDFIAAVFEVMARCPQHTFQILTKRPELMRAHLDLTSALPPKFWGLKEDVDVRVPEGTAWPLPNVWLGVSVEDQRRADERIPILLDTPAAVRFLSCEPLLGPVGLDRWMPNATPAEIARYRGEPESKVRADLARSTGIDWIIVGGESGPKARPMDLAWTRSLVDQGRAAGVPVFVKQLGRLPVMGDHGPLMASETGAHLDSYTRVPLLDHLKGGNIDEWPADLRVREFPAARA